MRVVVEEEGRKKKEQIIELKRTPNSLADGHLLFLDFERVSERMREKLICHHDDFVESSLPTR